MTKTQFKKKIASMKRDINQYLDSETLRLFKSGAIDIEAFEDDFLLPRIILSVALENLTKNHQEMVGRFAGPETKKELENLRRF